MSNHIRELRQLRGLSLRELADRMSTPDDPVHFTTIAKIERSQRKLTYDWAVRFADALDQPLSAVTEDLPGVGFPLVARQHPVIGQVAAGNWREAVHETRRYIAAPVSGKNVFGLEVNGDSMDQIAPAGATVLVDPDQFELHDGSLYVIMNGEGETTFKRFRASPARLEPLSSNPLHQIIPLGQAPFSVVGKVEGVYLATP